MNPGAPRFRQTSADPGPLAGRRLTALFAHPDDEVYSAGATLSLCAEAGAEVRLICASRGEAAATRRDDRPAMARRRSAELAASCDALGLAPPHFLELPDGGLGELPRRELLARLAEAVRATGAELLLTHGPDGAYGHRDHVVLAAAALELTPVMGADAPTRILQCAFPVGLFHPLRNALHRIPGIIDREWRQRTLGVERRQAAWVLELDEPLRRRKLAAMACHRSQLPDGDPAKFLHPEIARAVLSEEWFTVGFGPPLPEAARHPFAGLGNEP